MRSCALALLLSSSCGGSAIRPPTQDATDAIDAERATDADDANAIVDATLPAADSTCSVCPIAYGPLAPLGVITADSLDELSGIVESRAVAGTFFVHNDSGDRSRFFAINGSAQRVAEYNLRDLTAVDWEDIALGPCGAERCVFIGDIGDNDLARASYRVVWIREPTPPREKPADLRVEPVAWQSLTFRYPDGSHNAETLLVHPAQGDLYIVTKVAAGASGVYALRAPLRDGESRVAERVGEIELPPSGGQLITGGDLHPCGDRLLVRTYTRLFEYVLPPGAPFERLFAETPTMVPVRSERQGEAVGWRTNGRGYVTVSEGAGASLNAYGCQ